MKTVYFVRHALSTANVSHTIEHDDKLVELSEEGHGQALTVGERFKSIPVEIILCSTFKRTLQTAAQIQKATGSPIIESELLTERKHPSALGGMDMYSEEVLDMRTMLLNNAHQKDWHHSDEENYWDLIDRAHNSIKLIESREEKSIVVVTHSAFLKAILTTMMFGVDTKPEHFEAMYHFFLPKNTGITVCEYKKVQGTIRKEPQWRLMTFNDYAHLGE